MIAPQEVELGKTITFEGYADDYGTRIKAVEFSLDDGATWAAHDVPDATADLWVRWTFSYRPTEPGHYRLKVRSVNEDGKTSPAAAVAEFYVA